MFFFSLRPTTYFQSFLFYPPPLHTCRARRPSSTWSSTTSRPHTSTSPSTSTLAPEDGRLLLIWWGRWEAAVHTCLCRITLQSCFCVKSRAFFLRVKKVYGKKFSSGILIRVSSYFAVRPLAEKLSLKCANAWNLCLSSCVQTDHLTVMHTCSSESLRLMKAFSQQVISSYFVRNKDKRAKDVKDIYLHAGSKKAPRLPSQALLSHNHQTKTVHTCCSLPLFSTQISLFDCSFSFMLLSFTDQFAAVPGCSEHPHAGPFGPLCGPGTQDQRQPGRSPPGERRPVWTTADVAG